MSSKTSATAASKRKGRFVTASGSLVSTLKSVSRLAVNTEFSKIIAEPSILSALAENDEPFRIAHERRAKLERPHFAPVLEELKRLQSLLAAEQLDFFVSDSEGAIATRGDFPPEIEILISDLAH